GRVLTEWFSKRRLLGEIDSGGNISTRRRVAEVTSELQRWCRTGFAQEFFAKMRRVKPVNHSRKPNLLRSPWKLAASHRAFHIETIFPSGEAHIAVDNKQLRGKMWEKVVESGRYSKARGQR